MERTPLRRRFEDGGDDVFLKIQLENSEGSRRLYTFLPSDWVELINELGTLFPKENVPSLRKYWIDEENDDIEIIDSKTYQVFLMKAKQKKIYLETQGTENTRPTQHSPRFIPTTEHTPRSAPKADVHEGIICDGCNKSPIIGFRYKCVQCPDYDLCADCEGKKMHAEHVMFRFPTSVKNIPFNRRFLKKMKRGCFIHHDSEEDTPRHHGRRHCHNNIFSSLYTMMHDMAEGTEGPTEESGAAQAGSGDDGDKRNKKEDRKARKPCQREIPVIDPNYIKTGVQILGNFSEMFSKMLNPSVVTIDIDVDTRDSEEAKERSSQTREDDTTEEKKEDKKEDRNAESKEATGMAASSESNFQTAGNTSDERSKVSTPVEGACALPPNAPTTSIQGTEHEELDWTMINPPVSTSPRRDSVNSSVSGGSNKSVTSNKGIGQPDSTSREGTSKQGTPKEGTPIVDYAKLSKDLFEHLRREEMQTSVPSTETVPETLKKEEQKAQEETRAQIVYHKDRRINDAVHAMMSMGFSNDSNLLTYLLESVNGDISKALDLMKPSK